ncbi:hypothetical protein EBE87_15770 [Pseudoroseomonas wenyumeiae]|uniref:Uncharacterized protein n=1 Tax=Teichococcus wenyumeiae TaxID=2478470 RepID=A0A3A9JF80_9PROT|nr:hypothetical protein [Pseudoroseomonas wenyumeiae]RKK04011.1 hypothetical protein D6Z83_11710 [Pseudoroseomonas wenyumeiae]RMI19409.1 hypothetical protein EBE87_20660 [Pseudoroseomonas wenyumeiae]RMI20280.1 hypothetical protein EBE87_15770 [Pseudoroseomonas wenyumeiae]
MNARVPIQYADLLPPAAPLLRAVRFDIIETLAGPIAEMRHARQNGLDGYLARRAGIKEILGLDAPSLEGGDIDDVALRLRFLMRHTPGEPAEVLTKLWEAAWELVEVEWPGINTMARVVAAAGSMDGDRFEETWRRLARPPLKRLERKRRSIGTSALSWAGELRAEVPA